MLNFFERIILVSILAIPQVAFSQGIDIPEFMEEDEPESEAPTLPPKNNSSTGYPATAQIFQPQKTVGTPPPSEVSKETTPNLGRNEIPLERLVYSHSPLPELSINLTRKESPKDPIPTPKEWPAISLSDSKTTSDDDISLINGSMNSLDARDFELNGFSLGMTPMDIGKIAIENGYKITKSQKEFPLFLTTRYEQECRLSGLYIPHEIRSCIRQKGQENNTIFLKNMTVESPNKKESYFFEFTSPATENKAWRITYFNKGDNSLNFTRINTAKKLNRRDQFFRAVFSKFGYPSDSTNFIWGQKDDSFMQVSMYGTNYDAQITLTDTVLSDEDYFEAKEWLEENPAPEQFNLGE